MQALRGVQCESCIQDCGQVLPRHQSERTYSLLLGDMTHVRTPDMSTQKTLLDISVSGGLLPFVAKEKEFPLEVPPESVEIF